MEVNYLGNQLGCRGLLECQLSQSEVLCKTLYYCCRGLLECQLSQSEVLCKTLYYYYYYYCTSKLRCFGISGVFYNVGVKKMFIVLSRVLSKTLTDMLGI